MKLAKVVIFGAGYVLGARAGRDRYAQIMAAAQRASQRLEAYGNGGSTPHDRGTPVAPADGGSGQQ